MDKRLNIDEYGIFLIWVGIILNIISYFTKWTFLNILGLVVVIQAIFRALSRNKDQRALENKMFKEKILNPVKKSFKNFKNETVGDKDHKYVSCPHCGQKLRIPKKKGKVRVRCPKCGSKFDARS